MITFIISHNEHSCPSYDVIHSDHCVPTRDLRLLPIRSLPIRAQCATSPPSSKLLPSPLPSGLRADWQHLGTRPFFSLLILQHPQSTSHPTPIPTVNITPYYPFSTVTLSNCIANSHTYSLLKRSSHINGNYASCAFGRRVVELFNWNFWKQHSFIWGVLNSFLLSLRTHLKHFFPNCAKVYIFVHTCFFFFVCFFKSPAL